MKGRHYFGLAAVAFSFVGGGIGAACDGLFGFLIGTLIVGGIVAGSALTIVAYAHADDDNL